MHIFLISWATTSIIAFIMIYVTEKETIKGFTGEDAFLGIICCSVPYVFFILSVIGLVLAYLDKKKHKKKMPTITQVDVEKYHKTKKILNKQP